MSYNVIFITIRATFLFREESGDKVNNSMINIFHGSDLDQTFQRACSQTLADYEIKDCQVNYLNHEYVLIVKTEKIVPNHTRKNLINYYL